MARRQDSESETDVGGGDDNDEFDEEAVRAMWAKEKVDDLKKKIEERELELPRGRLLKDDLVNILVEADRAEFNAEQQHDEGEEGDLSQNKTVEPVPHEHYEPFIPASEPDGQKEKEGEEGEEPEELEEPEEGEGEGEDEEDGDGLLAGTKEYKKLLEVEEPDATLAKVMVDIHKMLVEVKKVLPLIRKNKRHLSARIKQGKEKEGGMSGVMCGMHFYTRCGNTKARRMCYDCNVAICPAEMCWNLHTCTGNGTPGAKGKWASEPLPISADQGMRKSALKDTMPSKKRKVLVGGSSSEPPQARSE